MTDPERHALIKLIEWGRTMPIVEGGPEGEALLAALDRLENAIIFGEEGVDPAVIAAYFAPHDPGD